MGNEEIMLKILQGVITIAVIIISISLGKYFARKLKRSSLR